MAKTQVTTEVVTIGLAEAELLQGANTHNRNFRPRKQNLYAIDMLHGKWVQSGEPIKISRTGMVLDGQHRIGALIQACTEGAVVRKDLKLEPDPELRIPMIIVRGLEPSAQEVMDSGIPRRLYDALSLRDEHNTMLLAAILRIIYAWKMDERRGLGRGDVASGTALLDMFEEDPDVYRELARQASNMRNKVRLTPAVLALCLWLFEDRDPEDAETFFERLADGEHDNPHDPIWKLREKLRDLPGGKRSTAYLTALTIKAWNLYRSGETVQQFGFKMGGSHPETFPEPM